MKPYHLVLWLAPLAACLVGIVIYLSLSPDAVLLGVLLSPVLLVVGVAFGLSKRGPIASSAAACMFALLAIIPMLWFYGIPLRSEVFFLLWSQTHRQKMQEATGKDEILQHFDGWGFAGMDNDTYLVSDTENALAAAVDFSRPVIPASKYRVAEKWAKSHRLRCDIVGVQRVWRGFYVVMTYECAL